LEQGVLLTYGSYLSEGRQPLVKSSLVIIGADLAITFMVGLMMFSLVFTNRMDPAQRASLIFLQSAYD
jgi:SNF family Na+-dependent transporter